MTKTLSTIGTVGTRANRNPASKKIEKKIEKTIRQWSRSVEPHHEMAEEIVGLMIAAGQLEAEKVGKVLGCGGEGFCIGYGRGKTLKINTGSYQDGRPWEEIDSTLWYLQEVDSSSVVGIHDWAYYGEYWTILMDRLKPLNQEERDAVDVAIDEQYPRSYSRFRREKDPTEYLRKTRRMKCASDLDNRVREFFLGLNGIRAYHDDLIYFNIMKNSRGELKAVDVESFIMEEE